MGYTSRKLRVLKFATGTERENVVVSKENEFYVFQKSLFLTLN